MGTTSDRSSSVRGGSRDIDRRRPGADADGRRAEGLLETLEDRILLGGDHPSFMLPLDVGNSTPIVLDGDGLGNDTGTIDPAGDDDLFSFTAPSDDFVTVWADTVNTAMASELDSRVEVYDSAGMLVGQGSTQGQLTAGTFIDGWAGFVAQAGETYFVRVLSDQMMGAGSTGDYVVRVDAQTGTLTFDADMEFLEGTGEITIAGDDEVFRFEAGPGLDYDSLATIGRTWPRTSTGTSWTRSTRGWTSTTRTAQRSSAIARRAG